MKRFIVAIFFLFFCAKISSQNNRISTPNSIGWYNAFVNTKFHENWSAHAEFQWRRSEYISEDMQNLFRVGVNYHLNPRITFRVGYALIETFPYGEIPINGLGKDFTEHRIYEMLQLEQKEGRVNLSHRFMLEQRFVGRYSNASIASEDEFPLLNRARYMIRAQMPLKGNSLENKTPYIALYNEVFVGFGNNVGENIFDQNRLGILLGYKVNNLFRIEAGFLNQMVQLGREIDGKNVFQHNNGFVINTYFNLDFSSKK